MRAVALIVAMALAAPMTIAGVAPAGAQVPKGQMIGLSVGAQIPAFSVTTSKGDPASFDTLKGDKGMVLAFFRSADWCPFCKGQLRDLNTAAAELKSLGYPLTALSYDSVETLDKFAAREGLTYTLVSDPDSKVIDAFDVRNKEVANSKRFSGIPHPAIFVIGADGKVKAKLFEERYQDRPPAALVVETVKGLN